MLADPRKLEERRYGFAKSQRLLNSGQFDRAFRSGCFAADHILVCNAARNELGFSRLGLSVSRKVGCAVVRNRWKRAIREAFRLQQDRLPSGYDFVLRPKAGASFQSHQIPRSLREVTQRAARRVDQATHTGTDPAANAGRNRGRRRGRGRHSGSTGEG